MHIYKYIRVNYNLRCSLIIEEVPLLIFVVVVVVVVLN